MTNQIPRDGSVSRTKLPTQSAWLCLPAAIRHRRASWSPGENCGSTALGMDTRLTDDHHDSLRRGCLLTFTHLVETHVRKALARISKRHCRVRSHGSTERRRMLCRWSSSLPHSGHRRHVHGNRRPIGSQRPIVRTEDPADRRAYLVKLTKEGRRLLRRWPRIMKPGSCSSFPEFPTREQRALHNHCRGARERHGKHHEHTLADSEPAFSLVRAEQSAGLRESPETQNPLRSTLTRTARSHRRLPYAATSKPWSSAVRRQLLFGRRLGQEIIVP